MPIPPHLTRRLAEILGEDVAEDLVTWIEGQRTEWRDAMRADFAELRHEMQVGFATLETRFERRFGDLIKWSFVFWVGAVAAVAMLAGVLP
jgi:hypothetical protein